MSWGRNVPVKWAAAFAEVIEVAAESSKTVFVKFVCVAPPTFWNSRTVVPLKAIR